MSMEYKHWMVVTNPGADCNNSMNISYHTDIENVNTCLEYRKITSNNWIKAKVQVEESKVFDNIYSITSDRVDTYETCHFLHATCTLNDLDKNTVYVYRIDKSINLYEFKTAKDDFSYLWISDFHSYTPLKNRLARAMDLSNSIINKHKDIDFVFCTGDSVAYGGSYSFWNELYKSSIYKKYMIASILGNHDYMSRGNLKNTSMYFKEVNNFPNNSFIKEEKVFYYFLYGKTLFLVMHNEHMGVEEIVNDEVEKAYEWVSKTIENTKCDTIILCQHYQWINGVNGKDRKFGYLRWKDICDKYHIKLAMAANDHTYLRTYKIYQDEINDNGTVYMQCPSSDGERGVELSPLLEPINHKICTRYATGSNTIGAIYVKVTDGNIKTILYDKDLNVIDESSI